ncbi:protein scylla-like [Glossina fuscipes]|uniref:Protein scylla-like n=1 Tax=Glossina fuscipes TaxID=7396 RepID=A0A8U0W4W6_9MUSC|nr:protein scylla-like [Glossina fuscipes]KAI9587768.1 hypothetical protein GQX74_003614 [Glossina fuscipes]
MPFVPRLSKSDLNKSLNIFTLNPNTVLNNKMEVLTVQNQYTDQRYRNIATSRIKDWSRSLNSNSRGQQEQQQQQQQREQQLHLQLTEEQFDCGRIEEAAINELSLRLLSELRVAKTRNLTCTEVSLPSDLTMRIATDIVRVSEREPCGVRGCTVFIEYEEEPNNVRRIAKLKLDEEMVSTFEIYLTLRQDKRGWTALLPQFIKGLSRTVTISPDYTINKRKLYTHDSN